MKKSYFKLSLQVVSFIFLCSCQHELLQTEEEYSLKSQQSTIQQLLRSQLEKKDPQLVSKIDRLQVKNKSANARVYTDAENGFSVDTEKTVYVEDAQGNKTYTFKIERNNTNSGILENLILKQTGISEYAAYLVKYDQTAVENLGSIAQGDLKNHITFTSLGTKTGAEVFGKYDANSSCNVMMPYASNWVYVGGTMCYENAHDYAHIGDCVYKNDPAKAPTQGYATYEVSYGLVDICGSGGSSGGVGTMPVGGTIPMGGVGSGSTTFNPCNNLKTLLNRTISNLGLPNNKVSDLINSLNLHLPANNPQNDGTKELSLNAFEINNGNDLEVNAFESTFNENLEATVTLNINTKYVFLGHDHPGGLSIFSLADLKSIKEMIEHGSIDENTTFFMNSYQQTQYAFTIDNVAVFKVWLDQFFMGWDLVLPPGIKNEIIETRENQYEKHVKKTYSIGKNEQGFLNFMNENSLKITVFSKENNQWSQLTLGNNNVVKKIPCN